MHNYAFLQLISNRMSITVRQLFSTLSTKQLSIEKNRALTKLFDDIISVDLSIYRENIRPTHHARMHAGLRYDD